MRRAIFEPDARDQILQPGIEFVLLYSPSAPVCPQGADARSIVSHYRIELTARKRHGRRLSRLTGSLNPVTVPKSSWASRICRPSRLRARRSTSIECGRPVVTRWQFHRLRHAAARRDLRAARGHADFCELPCRTYR